MKLGRVFIKPDGARWFDVPLRPEQTAQTLFSALRGEGAIVTPWFVIPAEAVHYISILEAPDQPGQPIPEFVIPDGKPN